MIEVKLVDRYDPILYLPCTPIRKVTKKISDLATEMVNFMVSNGGIGLAANQVGYGINLIVIGFTSPGEFPFMLANPKITKRSKKVRKSYEGCLSFPGDTFEVTRHESITVEGRDHNNRHVVLDLVGLRAIVVQHEVDHLNGITCSISGKKLNLSGQP